MSPRERRIPEHYRSTTKGDIMIRTDGTATICNAQDDERAPGPAALAAEIPALRDYAELPSLSISFGGEASATFAHVVRDFSGWNVQLTLLDGTKVDARLVGSTREHGWLDNVTYLVLDENSNPTGEARTGRVTNVHVY